MVIRSKVMNEQYSFAKHKKLHLDNLILYRCVGVSFRKSRTDNYHIEKHWISDCYDNWCL